MLLYLCVLNSYYIKVVSPPFPSVGKNGEFKSTALVKATSSQTVYAIRKQYELNGRSVSALTVPASRINITMGYSKFFSHPDAFFLLSEKSKIHEKNKKNTQALMMMNETPPKTKPSPLVVKNETLLIKDEC